MLSGWQRELQIYVICPTFQLSDSAAVQNWKRSAHAAAFARWSALSGQYRGTQGGWELVQNKLSPKPLSTLKSTAMRPWGALPLQPYTGIILANITSSTSVWHHGAIKKTYTIYLQTTTANVWNGVNQQFSVLIKADWNGICCTENKLYKH